MALKCSVIVCAHNEAQYLEACLHSLLAQSRLPDEIIVVDNASSDDTQQVAHRVRSVQVISEPRKGLTIARETGRRHAQGDLLLYIDADCRTPIEWLSRMEARFARDQRLVGVSGPYRYYDWDWTGRWLIRAYDFTVAPATQFLVKYLLRAGSIFYGGNFGVRREVLAAIGGFDTSIEFHGEDTNLGRRLCAVGKVSIAMPCWVHTSARRFLAMGTGAVIRLYVRNFWSEILYHSPKDTSHVDVRS